MSPEVRLQRSLSHVNAARRQAGFCQLHKLPRGYRYESDECIFAKALRRLGRGISVGTTYVVAPKRVARRLSALWSQPIWRGEDKQYRVELPPDMRWVVKAFDGGHLPQLDAELVSAYSRR